MRIPFLFKLPVPFTIDNNIVVKCFSCIESPGLAGSLKKNKMNDNPNNCIFMLDQIKANRKC